jgi:hypothetical protein
MRKESICFMQTKIHRLKEKEIATRNTLINNKLNIHLELKEPLTKTRSKGPPKVQGLWAAKIEVDRQGRRIWLIK